MKFVDSHAHLTSDTLYPQVDALLSRAKTAGLSAVVNICTNTETLQRGLLLSKKYPWVYNAAATTPHDVATEGENVFSFMEQHALQGHLIAVGETGLDYYYHHSPIDTQKHFLKRYLKLALKSHLPVIIHCREAFTDLFHILDTEYMVAGHHGPGVLHCFTGNLSEAAEVIKRGWYLSLSGILTFKKSETLRAVAKMVPLDRLLVETDAPYLAPQSRRGSTNEPSFLPETIQAIANAKDIGMDDVASATLANAERFFSFDSKQQTD